MSIHGGDIYRNAGVLDFSANCNCFGMPDAVRDAALRGVALAESYPDPECEALREALAGYEGVDSEQIVCGNGASELLMAIARAFHPKEALLLAPDFYGYERALAAVGTHIHRHRLLQNLDFLPDERFLDELKHTSADCVLFSNPHNPTGCVLVPEYLEQVVKTARSRGIRLIVDECFVDFLEEPERYSCKKYLEGCGNVLVLKAFTKTFACAGLRLGYLMTKDAGTIAACRRQLPEWNVSVPAACAGIAAARCRDWLREHGAKIRGEREWLRRELESLGYKVVPGKANFLFFSGQTGLYEHCLSRGVLIRDCSNYRGLSAGMYRVCVKRREENEQLLRVVRMKSGGI